MINSIKDNTISEAGAKKINELNKIKKIEINGKSLIESQKKLLRLFDDLLKTIFNANKNENKSESKNDSVNESESESERVNKNKSINENKSESENENEKESYDGQYYRKRINNNFKEINETKSFQDQIDILIEIPDFSNFWYNKYLKIIKRQILFYLNQNLHTSLVMLMIIYLKKYLALHL